MTLFDTLMMGLVAGLILGTIVLIVAAFKNKLALGFGGFFTCGVLGTLGGILLAGPACGVFIWLIVKDDAKNMAETHKRCPFCAEEIHIMAKVCKHCNKELTL